jgi:hypothetical protein
MDVLEFDKLISVQATYITNVASAGVLTCNDVIKIPLGYAVRRQTAIGHGSYNIIPVVEIDIPLEFLVFEIITNEGVTVEPFSTSKLPAEANPYNNARVYFVLPSGTTGIKDVIFKPKYPSVRVALQFGVMSPPYNYDNALFGVITSAVSELDGRVDALESKRLYVKQVPLKSYPGFFQIFGTNDQNGILGWEFTFTNTGNMLTLTSGDLGSHASNTILNSVGIAESKKLTLTYDKGSSIFSLYDITEGVTGAILSQRYLASGLGRTTDAPQGLHLIIDGSEQNVLNIGSGFVSYI